jgi:hypothetical protein
LCTGGFYAKKQFKTKIKSLIKINQYAKTKIFSTVFIAFAKCPNGTLAKDYSSR